jgi:hypothetical protein
VPYLTPPPGRLIGELLTVLHIPLTAYQAIGVVLGLGVAITSSMLFDLLTANQNWDSTPLGTVKDFRST